MASPIITNFSVAGGGGEVIIGDMFKSEYDPANDGKIPIAAGGTGATTAEDARTNLDAQQADADLTALAGLSSAGLVARTGSGTAATRTITAGSSNVTITDGDGVLGNPVINLTADAALLTGTQEILGDKTFSGALNVDSITERTSGNGVSVDGVLLKDSFVEMTEIATPSTPAANKTRMYAKDVGGISKLFYIDDTGEEISVGRSPNDIFGMVFAQSIGKMEPGATLPVGYGVFNAVSLIASSTGSVTRTIGPIIYSATTTGASTNNYRGYVNSNSICTTQGLPIFHGVFCLSSVADTRMFIGLSSVITSTQLASDNPSTSYIGFQFSTARGDANLQAVCGNGSAQTVTSTGVASSAFDSTSEFIQVLMVVESTSSVKCYVRDSAGNDLGSTVTLSANLPSSATALFPYYGIGTLTTAAKTFNFAGMSVKNRGFLLNNFPS